MARKSIIDQALKDEVRQSHKKKEMQRQWEESMPEKKKEWQKELEWELDYEQRLMDVDETAQKGIQIYLWMKRSRPAPQGHVDQSLRFYANNINCLFHSMHRIVYIESLLSQEMPDED
jgi:hypothetical protein